MIWKGGGSCLRRLYKKVFQKIYKKNLWRSLLFSKVASYGLRDT